MATVGPAFTSGVNATYKEGTLGPMNNKNITPRKLKEESSNDCDFSSDEIKQLQTQVQDMQLEIDVLKETINCLFLRKCTVVPEERIPLFRSKYTVRPEQDTACIILASASLLA